MTTKIRFRVNEDKALESVVWLAAEKPDIDFFHISKILFFADLAHLALYGRPILGDHYVAMENGPVPSLVYNILKSDPYLSPDLLEKITSAFEVNRPNVKACRKPDLDFFSESDIECLASALRTYGDMSFRTLSRLTHEHPAYVAASLNGEMDYALMFDENTPDREAILEELREKAPYLVL